MTRSLCLLTGSGFDLLLDPGIGACNSLFQENLCLPADGMDTCIAKIPRLNPYRALNMLDIDLLSTQPPNATEYQFDDFDWDGEINLFDEDEDIVQATYDQLCSPALRLATVTFVSCVHKQDYQAKNRQFFTLQEFVDRVLEFEKKVRALSFPSLGGIDTHHVFFEGLRHPQSSPSDHFELCWGS